MDNQDNRCWISDEEKIVSFHEVPDYTPKEFEDHTALMNYLLTSPNVIGYRVQ